MHEREHKQFSTFQHRIQVFFGYKYRQMSFKEELQKKYHHHSFLDEKKIFC